jgi:DNA-binding winged helix-turn-helix (wHTH) protein
MRNTKLFIATIAILLLIIPAGFVVGDRFADSKKKIVSDVEPLFKQAISQDHNRRLKDAGYLYYKENLISHDWPKEKIVFTTEQGELTQTNIDSIRALPEEEKVKIFRETLLLDGYPINPDSLNACFQGILQQRDIPVSTAIRYTEVYNNKTQYSGTDTAFLASAYPLEEYKTGIFNEISIQAYIKVPLTTVVEKAGMGLAIPVFTWLGIFAVYILYMYKVIKKKKEAANLFEEKQAEEKQAEALLWLDSERCCLHYKDQEVVLTPMLAQLVALFLKKPGYFVTKEEIVNEFWRNLDDPSNCISQTISRLRDDLACFPDLKIKTDRGKGYQIVVPVSEESL